MNKKGESVIWDNVIYILLAVGFFAVMWVYLWSQANSASLWEDYYSKELSKIINLANPGDKITIDAQEAVEIAKSNELPSFSKIFTFDNINQKVCVKLSLGRQTCYSYFNNVIVTDIQLKLRPENNVLEFTISEK